MECISTKVRLKFSLELQKEINSLANVDFWVWNEKLAV